MTGKKLGEQNDSKSAFSLRLTEILEINYNRLKQLEINFCRSKKEKYLFYYYKTSFLRSILGGRKYKYKNFRLI